MNYLKTYLFFFIFSIILPVKMMAQRHQFSLGKTEFLMDGNPFQIISGEMHPARIPEIYWRNRIRMAKAMGCNAIAVYIFWNYHEKEPGQFDFSTENRNIAEFLRICQQEKMWVLLRPGPYVCAEWDFGGLPPYLLKNPGIKVRCMDPGYMTAVARYVSKVADQIRPLLITNGGPVIMVQVENEYGSYANDRAYVKKLRALWLQNGINVPFYTADGPAPALLEAGSLAGAAIGLDSGTSDADFETAFQQNPDVPSFSSETYPGWLTHWGESWQKPPVAEIIRQVTYLLEHKKSFNLYVIHGGTNFGFTAGANAFSPTQFQPDITSYDYNAPINEQGVPTAKYFALRTLISKYVKYKIPEVPPSVKAMDIPPFEMVPFTSVWDRLPKPIDLPQPVPMENLGQYQGFILYRTILAGHKSGKLTITEPHDYALVLLNGKLIDSVYRDGGKWTINIPETKIANPVLDILVENMGHINFAQFMIDRKGITDRVTLEGMTLCNWQIFKLPMDEQFVKSLAPQMAENLHDGVYFKGSFEIDEPHDTYLNLSNFRKGLVWVNGHNLGRYWNTGPQFHLYCPANWLIKGKNHVIVFDLHQQTKTVINGLKTLEF